MTEDGGSDRLREELRRYERDSRFLRKDSDDRKTMEEVFDRATLLVLRQLMRQGAISELNGIVSSGKEARVYWGVTAEGTNRAVKIYLTVSAEFRRRLNYIAGDRRFGKLPSNSREMIFIWVRKEFKNLQLAESAGIRVPKPYAFEKNVLSMEFIGTPPAPAPIFAESEVDEKDYEWTFDTISKLYNSAGLVHADLSEFNFFKNGTELVLFDFGSAVLESHPQAIEFLTRDIKNMVRFFKKRGIGTREPEDWLEEITK
ncbi:MAG: serine protein kinase RIO [Thaumarchaeota archaeon]|nr:serine protein kinase RIO [Nitrososphaerota archaeon]